MGLPHCNTLFPNWAFSTLSSKPPSKLDGLNPTASYPLSSRSELRTVGIVACNYWGRSWIVLIDASHYLQDQVTGDKKQARPLCLVWGCPVVHNPPSPSIEPLIGRTFLVTHRDSVCLTSELWRYTHTPAKLSVQMYGEKITIAFCHSGSWSKVSQKIRDISETSSRTKDADIQAGSSLSNRT